MIEFGWSKSIVVVRLQSMNVKLMVSFSCYNGSNNIVYHNVNQATTIIIYDAILVYYNSRVHAFGLWCYEFRVIPAFYDTESLFKFYITQKLKVGF